MTAPAVPTPEERTGDQHDAATFAACLVLADTVRRFLLQNEKALSVLDELNVLTDEYRNLMRDSHRAQAEREQRIAHARESGR